MFIRPDMLVDDVMRRWPWTIRTFIQWGMKCVGCPFGTFHSIEHACEEHKTDRAAFLEALDDAVQSGPANRSRHLPGASVGGGRGW
jgi:hybrid cluster-associated redox disulfide protein